MGINMVRICYPKIWYHGILYISSCRNLRNGIWRKGLWTFPGSKSKTLMWETPFLYPEERSILMSKDKETQRRHLKEQALLTAPPSSLHSVHLCPVTSFHNFPLFITPSIKALGFNHCFDSSFPHEDFCHIKLRVNKCVCFSLVNLSFVTKVPVENLDE